MAEARTLRLRASVLLSSTEICPLVFDASTGVVEGSASETGLLLAGEEEADGVGPIDEEWRTDVLGRNFRLGRGMSETGRLLKLVRAGADLGRLVPVGMSSSDSGSSGKLSMLLALTVLRRFFCIAMWFGTGSLPRTLLPSEARGTWGILVLRVRRRRACLGVLASVDWLLSIGLAFVAFAAGRSDSKEDGRVLAISPLDVDQDVAAEPADEETWLTGRDSESLANTARDCISIRVH